MKVLVCICLISSAVLFGQEVAQISGAVTDQTGAVVPDVDVTATQVETETKRTVRTDSAGFYVIPNLPLGPYRLEATKMGFRTFVQTGIVLQVGTNPNIPVTLAVGSTSEQVEVQANANQVETRSAGVRTTVVETQRILDLPLNGRQATDLIPLSGLAVTTSANAPVYTRKHGTEYCGGRGQKLERAVQSGRRAAFGHLWSLHGSSLSGRPPELNLGANWTWSHCIGLQATNISNFEATDPNQPYQNNGPQNRHLDMGDFVWATL